MIPEMTLTAPDGSNLHLISILPGEVYFEAEAYIAFSSLPRGTIYEVRRGDKIVQIESSQAIVRGINFYPGDPEHFGRLEERAMFKQVGVIDAA